MSASQNPWPAWRHATKIDPDKLLAGEAVAAVAASGTDVILVGGTQGITPEKVRAALQRLSDCPAPRWLEVSTPDLALASVFWPADERPQGYLIPLVLNAPGSDWLIGAQARALAAIAPLAGGWEALPWHAVAATGYIVLNPEAAVARLTGARVPAGDLEAAALAACAVRLLGLPAVYAEYSGTYGDLNRLRAMRQAMGGAHLIYGGGIDSAEKAAAVAAIADTVVVGNLVHSPQCDRLAETVAAVRAAARPG